MFGNAQSNPGTVLDRNSLSEMNLKVLKRIDPQTQELLASAGHVALYDFMVGEKKWVHKGVEGTLFLIRRHSVPIYRYIVLNKKSQDHYMEDLHNGFKFEAGERYGRMFLLYKNSKSEVVGIWFYDTEECEKVLALLQGIASQHPQPPQPQTEEGTPASYPLTIGSLPPYSPAPPKMDLGISSTALPDESFLHRGLLPTPGASNPLHSSDGRTLADAPGLMPRPGNHQQSPSGPANPLERLFGQSAARAASSQAHAASSTPQLPPSASFGGLPPFRNAEQAQAGSLPADPNHLTTPPSWPTSSHTPPNGLAVVSPQSGAPLQPLPTPFAGQTPPHSSRAATPQVSASLPSLLKPSYFQASSSAAGSTRLPDQEGTPAVTPPTQTANSQTQSVSSQTLQQTNAQEAFMKLFNARDKGPVTPKEQHAAAEVHKSLESLVAETPLRNGLPGRIGGGSSAGKSASSNPRVSGDRFTHADGGANRHAQVRGAVKALAESDAFIHILVAELDKSGLLRQ